MVITILVPVTVVLNTIRIISVRVVVLFIAPSSVWHVLRIETRFPPDEHLVRLIGFLFLGFGMNDTRERVTVRLRLNMTCFHKDARIFVLGLDYFA
jgi:hypothetical protein